jgi:A/G-specific adenine glycosylase
MFIPDQQALLKWYQQEGRNLPWRSSGDPYVIWVSEIILQQTRVKQGLPYFERFLKRFPTLATLANAPLDDVLKAWEGLGYYARARNLHKAAKILNEHNGAFPRSYQQLETYPGIGPYTARAIAAFAFGEKVVVLDGNVFRVISRIYADPFGIDMPSSRKYYQTLADGLLGKANPAEYNQALMELGALVCKPKQPDCEICPWAKVCRAYATGTMDDFPVKTKSLSRGKKHVAWFYLLNESGKVFIRRRPDSGLWGGLYELPNYPEDQVPPELKNKSIIKKVGSFRHAFTHFEMELSIYQGKLPKQWNMPDGFFEVDPESLNTYAFPTALLNAFQIIRK